jgi:hypothetical protein
MATSVDSQMSSLAKESPLFDDNDPIMRSDPGHRYVRKNEKYFKTKFEKMLERLNFTTAMIHGSQLLHGASSASLIAFTRYNQERKGLLPAGELEKKGKVSFCGSNDAGRFGVNIDQISTVVVNALCDNIHRYAWAQRWTPEEGREEIAKHIKLFRTKYMCLQNPSNREDESLTYAVILKYLEEGNYEEAWKYFNDNCLTCSYYDMACLSEINIHVRRLAEWEKLDQDEKLLVTDPFPVLYGIKSMRENVYFCVSSCISHEVGLLGGASPDEVRVIFVPLSRIDFVRRLMLANGNNLTVEPFPKIPKSSKYTGSDVTRFE